MGKKFHRLLDLQLPPRRSAFLWGPRRVGKSYWIRETFPDAPLVDLLKSDVFSEYASRPALLRERFAKSAHRLVVIDEIQKVPALLDEVHWLIENTPRAFLLTGSSARKLRRGHANLLAGRAWRRTMVPLCLPEVGALDLERVMTTGLLPPHFLADRPDEDLRAYIGDYLKEEIAAEARTRDIPAFAEFLRVAALTSSELLNYANVARESGVSAKVVRTYFEILEDTYLGFRIPPWRKTRRRRLVETEKFYLFDVGVTNFLARRAPRLGGSEFGKSFEHYLLMELRAYQAYRAPDLELSFWRTSSGLEVDFVLGAMEVAVEVKSSARVHDGDLRGLRALKEEHRVRRAVMVCLEHTPRTLADGIEVLPWKLFLDALWAGDVIA
ncbi:MAG: ATP-binding protein [Deltaproteobacteria bacterium]|nr:ATP-binding protein [Deltaproteobacteria bacterium]